MCQGIYVCQGCVSRDQGINVRGFQCIGGVCLCLFTGIHTYVRGCQCVGEVCQILVWKCKWVASCGKVST